MTSFITYEENEQGLGLITINRPEAANALSKAVLDELNHIMDQLQRSKTIRVLVITGSGEKAFSAGADLKERRGMNEAEVVDAVTYIGDTINRVEKLPVPVLAAINGVAFGGGLELALACDIRILSEDAVVGLTETSLAIIPGAGGTQRLPRLIGLGQAKRLIYTAARVSSTEAASLGLVEVVVPQANVVNTALEMAHKISENGPLAIRQAKTAINHGTETDIATGLQIERLSYVQTVKTKDRLEGLEAFKEKRKPKYEGK